MVKDEILQLLRSALEKSAVEEKIIELERPASLDHGDYSTNIALKLSKKLSKTPEEIAKSIVPDIKTGDIVKKVEIVKPGFINFFLSTKSLEKEVNEIINKKSDYGKKDSKKFNILLEYGQPNTHKAPHVGHLFSYIYGESLARVLENEGNDVKRTNYQGDIGLHVAKCLYAVQKHKDEMVGLKTLAEKIAFLQKCYVEGSGAYEKGAEKEIAEINRKIYNKESSVLNLWNETRNWSVEFYKRFEEELGIKYDKYYFESETAELGKKIVKDNVGKVFEESQGAIVFRGEEYGTHTRVFINKHGNPTYEAKDLGLISLKIKDFKFDLSLVTTANEQSDYWKVIIAASELLFPEVKNKLKHLGFGMINLTTGKMSSRKGMIVEAFSLIDDVKKEIIAEYKTDDKLASQIADAAVKYSFLKSDVFKDIAFVVKTSVNREGDSGPYLLYTYVRTRSLLKENTVSKIKIPAEINKEEEILLRSLGAFPEIIEKSAKSYSPHLIAGYLIDLCQKFNYFYQKHQVLKAEGGLKEFRMGLTSAVGQIIKNGLYLLGIETVEKM